ncbi:nudix hydrolase [Salix suchowensis]|nr:nudix hydrolase [Salix suchowensis]
MATLLARTGRHRQRYVDQFRLVAGCIPYKLEKNVEDLGSNVEDRVLVLMISTPKRDDLVFPKGGWEDDETLDEAACREAIEEAGVKGILDVRKSMGVWEFRSKSSQNSCTLAGGCRGYMFGLQVTEELDPGQDRLLTIEEAFEHCRYDWMRDALKHFLNSLSRRKDLGRRSDLAEIRMIPVSKNEVEGAMLSPNYLVRPSGAQHLEDSSSKRVVQV